MLATVSAVAGAIWLPYLVEPRERVLEWSAETFTALCRLADEPGAGVAMEPLMIVFAAAEPDLWWAAAAGDVRSVVPGSLPEGYGSGVELEVPLCDTTRYLPWLEARVAALGGQIVRRAITSFDEAHAMADVVVNCAGLGARELAGDHELVPVRGQVLRVDRIELPHAIVDDTDPDQPVYVLPRQRDIVLGGTATAGDDRLEVDAVETAAIRVACERHLPQLRGAAVRGTGVGLRPFRPTVRLEIESRGQSGRLIHNYGHGGSGFTLAWGCAREVADLAG